MACVKVINVLDLSIWGWGKRGRKEGMENKSRRDHWRLILMIEPAEERGLKVLWEVARSI